MFGSDVLEVGIGVALILLFVSLICTAVREAIEIFFRTRAADLEQGIRELLDDPTGRGATTELYSHPMIFSLFLGRYDAGQLKSSIFGSGNYMKRGARVSLPTYIPATNFAMAIMDIVRDRAAKADADSAGTQPMQPAPTAPLSIASLRSAAEKIADRTLKQAVLSSLDSAGGDIDKVKANLALWFNGTMDSVSGWYKRRTQWILFLIGLAAAVAFNVDVLTIAKRLSQDKSLREGIVSQARGVIGAGEKVDNARLDELQKQSFKALTEQMDSLGYPIGWGRSPDDGRLTAAPQACRPIAGGIGGMTGAAADARSATEPAAKSIAKTDGKGVTNADAKTAAEPGKADSKGETRVALAKAARLADKATIRCLSLGTVDWLLVISGWLVTALAVMLGAPFWFDVLNKFMVIRSTVKPREKSQEEGSEDRSLPQTVSLQLAPRGGKQ